MMLQQLSQLYTEYSEFTSSNQMLGAVLAGLAVTTFVFLFKSIPNKIWNAFKKVVIASVEFNSRAGWRDSIGCEKLAIWANNNKTVFSSKFSIPVFDSETGEFTIGIGIGNNLVRYGFNLYLVHMELEKAEQTLKINYKITISTLWFRKSNLEDLLNMVFNIKRKKGLSIHEYSDDEEWREEIVPKRNFNTVITTDNVGQDILNACQTFIQSKQWYNDAGISYKLGIMLYGSPGTGKTSLIKAIASELNRDLYTLNLATSFDKKFIKAIRGMMPGSILSLEDIDCVDGTHDRDDAPILKTVGLNLATILNTLDGLVPLNDIIVIMSTNHIQKIDPALLRKGRSDLMIEIKPLDSAAVKQYTQMVYKRDVDFSGEIKGCDLQSIVLEHKTDFNGYQKALENYSNT